MRVVSFSGTYFVSRQASGRSKGGVSSDQVVNWVVGAAVVAVSEGFLDTGFAGMTGVGPE